MYELYRFKTPEEALEYLKPLNGNKLELIAPAETGLPVGGTSSVSQYDLLVYSVEGGSSSTVRVPSGSPDFKLSFLAKIVAPAGS